MTLVEKLNEKRNKMINNEEKIIDEIEKYYEEYFNNGEFETRLEKGITEEEIRKGEFWVRIEFWEHHDGCSGTHFRCGGKKWENTEDIYSNKVKGVLLRDIHKTICGFRLEPMLKKKMQQLGFKYLRCEDKEGRLGYFHKWYYFSW